jgi:hypothetical protein
MIDVDKVPPCLNRPPRVTGVWEPVQKGERIALTGGRLKPVYRWRWSPFVDRCAAHDGQGIGPNGENYPEAHGWLPWCRICTWFPSKETSP